MTAQHEQYPPIADYGFIADCHSVALVSREGSVDWCCMPRVDARSCFGRLLGWKSGGYCRIAPGRRCRTTRDYLPGTLVLETTFETDSGRARLLDCFTMRRGGRRDPYRQLLRVVEGIEGTVRFDLDVAPVFDYGAVRPWIRRAGSGAHVAIGGSDGLLISADLPLKIRGRHRLLGHRPVKPGERARLSMIYARPEDLDDELIDVPTSEELDRRLAETVDWWRTWSADTRYDGPHAAAVRRSATALKGLTHALTGAIAAAPTTSLPEAPGGSRNWDYRLSWVRDSAFAVRSLAELGHVREAEGFRRFMERSAAGSAEDVQILYGVGGERRLTELIVGELEGYRRAHPVRIGNAAERQVQLDVYGELLNLAWDWHSLGHRPDADYWAFLVDLVDAAGRAWRGRDRGIWEVRGDPQHFVLSKAMCWAALDRGLCLAKATGCDAPLEEWQTQRDAVRLAIERRGYDRRRGIFVQAFGRRDLDAALLLLPVSGFVAYDDPRMQRTTDAIMESLMDDGLLRRYTSSDGLEGHEGVFLPCSFWLAECLARQGRTGLAETVFDRALQTGNDLELFAEEFDPATGQMLGNFPQGLTHLSLVAAAVALQDARHSG